MVSCHYVDSRDFKALPDFLKPENYLKNAEMAMEDDYGMIDGVINTGPKQTVACLLYTSFDRMKLLVQSNVQDECSRSCCIA